MKKLLLIIGITLATLTISLTAFIYSYEVKYYCTELDYYKDKLDKTEKELGIDVYDYESLDIFKQVELYTNNRKYLHLRVYNELIKEYRDKCYDTYGMNKVERIIYELTN